MSVKKVIDVSKPVLTPNGDTYCEPKLDRKGRIMMEELDEEGNNVYKFQHQLTNKDTPVYVDKLIGDIITFALDKVDDKANSEDIRKRFALSCRVEDALSKDGKLVVENKDWKLIEGTLDNIKNPMFNYRIQEAIDTAELYKEEEKTDAGSA